jgi:hypothetical protein
MMSASEAMRLNPGSPAGGAPAMAFGANGPLSSPKLEHRRVQAERPVELARRRDRPAAWRRRSGRLAPDRRALDAKAVARARPEAGRKAAQDAVRVAGHRRAKDLAVAVVDAQRRALGVGEDERRFEAFRRNDDAEARRKLAHSAGLARAR